MNAIINNTKEDILYFKDEILKDIKKFEIKIGQKIDTQVLTTQNKIAEFETKIAAIMQKVNGLANQISTNTSLKEKVEEIYNFKIKVQQDAMIQQIKVDSIARDLKNAINKYDAILSDSIFYSGVIGIGCKFSNFHDLIDYLLNNINQLTLGKEKNVIDIKNMKKKYDTTLQNIKNQLDSINKDAKDSNKKTFDAWEERIKKIEEENVQKFLDLKIDNNKYVVELKDKTEKILETYKTMEKLKNDIEERIKHELNKFISMPPDYKQKLGVFQEEINTIKLEILQLTEFVKNHKFETKTTTKEEVVVEESKGEEKKPKKIINKPKTEKPKGVSLLKKYISGEITFEKYNQQLKLQNHHLKEEENKIDENDPNKIYNINFDNTDINQNNIQETNKIDSKAEKKKYVMNLANEAGITIIDNNRNFSYEINSDDYRNKNHHIKPKFQVNSVNLDSMNKKRNSKSNELINNDDENIQKIIKIYNVNHKQYKRIIETKNQANNTSFQDQDNIKDEIYEIDEINLKDYSQNRNNTANSSPRRYDEINYENKINEKQSNKSFHLEEKQYYPDINFLGQGLIEVINYNTKKSKGIKENRKGDLLEFIKKSYDDQEMNDEKKLFQLKNAIEFSKSIKNMNNANHSYNISNERFYSTLSYPFKKNIINNIFKKETNLKKNGYPRNTNRTPFVGLPNYNRNKSKSIISLEKINFDSLTSRRIDIDNMKYSIKKLNPLKLKGNNSSSNLMQKKIKDIDLFNKDDKKLGKLMNKLKEMIPYEDKISLFETSNIENLNKNVFSKKKIYFDKKDEKEEIKSKDLAMKKLSSVYKNEPKNANNISSQVNFNK